MRYIYIHPLSPNNNTNTNTTASRRIGSIVVCPRENNHRLIRPRPTKNSSIVQADSPQKKISYRPMAAPRIRKLITAQRAFDSVLLQGHDGHPIPWGVVVKKLAELFRFLASAFPALVAGIREWAVAMEQRAGSALAVALPVAAVVALVVLCCCCCGYL
uniref:Uncharacterized protein n=1 Tax=Triticum urartu TaxID=4572 RepID=A0A8R7PL96_TRIUA